MNWYKNRIFSSHNLQFPEKMEEQINDITNKCVEYYFSKQNKPIYIKKLKQRIYNSFIGEPNNVV